LRGGVLKNTVARLVKRLGLPQSLADYAILRTNRRPLCLLRDFALSNGAVKTRRLKDHCKWRDVCKIGSIFRKIRNKKTKETTDQTFLPRLTCG